MDNNSLISVIIPVHNTQNYLNECLNSLRLQTYENLEFICINDGSTDKSLQILEKYRDSDKRFTIIDQQNLGASEARNKGIAYANGKYISFIDSDDRVSLSLYQKFINIEKKPDIYMFNVCEYDKNTQSVLPNYFFSTREWQNHKDDNTIHTFKDNINPFSGNMSAVNKIFKTEFLQKLIKKIPDGKLFPPGRLFEDQYFFFLTMIYAGSILINPNPMYYYRSTNPDSTTKHLSARVFDIFYIVDRIENLLKQTNNYEEYKYAFFQHKYKQFSYLFFQAETSVREYFYKEMQERLKKYENENLNPQICERLTLYGVYKNILKLNAAEFYAKYNGKLK